MSRDSENRRPIAARSSNWAKSIAQLLTRAGIQPNQISVFGVLVSGLCAALLILSRDAEGVLRAALLVSAAICIVVRAGCNMFDGMVAVEFGRATKSGGVFNELPDRFSDSLMLVGAGYAVPASLNAAELSAALGWAAGLGALAVTYVRTLGASLGAAQDFSGIMAKQQRMAVMAIAFVASAFEGIWQGEGEVIVAGLVIVIIGCVITLVLRTARLLSRLEAQ